MVAERARAAGVWSLVCGRSMPGPQHARAGVVAGLRSSMLGPLVCGRVLPGEAAVHCRSYIGAVQRGDHDNASLA